MNTRSVRVRECGLLSPHQPSGLLVTNELLVVASKRISDLLVGVKHHSDLGAESSGGQVLGETGAHHAALAVGGGHLAPDGLIVDARLLVLGLVDKGDALAVVEGGGSTVLHVLDGDESSVVLLGSLASLETEEKTLGVKSTTVQTQYFSDQIKMRLEWLLT